MLFNPNLARDQNLKPIKQMNFERPRAKRIIKGIFAAMDCGKWFTQKQIVQRFIDGGYAEALATRYANALIAANTDIQHFSRWEIRGTKELVFKTVDNII